MGTNYTISGSIVQGGPNRTSSEVCNINENVKCSDDGQRNVSAVSNGLDRFLASISLDVVDFPWKFTHFDFVDNIERIFIPSIGENNLDQ